MKQADVIEQEKFLNFKIPAYRYFFVNTYLPVVKFKGMNLWREFYCELTPDGMVNLFIPEKTFLNPGRVLLGLLKKETLIYAKNYIRFQVNLSKLLNI